MLRDPTESPAQRILITTLGDYRHLMECPIPSSALVDVLDEFDLSNDAARKALSTLTKRGYLSRSKNGRETAYELSHLGRKLVSEASERIMDFGSPREWNGLWTAVAFSIEESLRHKRQPLRSALRALGFGPLYDGLWIAAYGESKDVEAVLADLEIDDATLFHGQFRLTPAKVAKLHDSWGLDEVREQYEAFLGSFTHFKDKLDRQELSPTAAFVLRTNLMDAWRVFPRIDPELPAPLEPQDWPRGKAKELFAKIYAETSKTAELKFASLVGVSGSG